MKDRGGKHHCGLLLRKLIRYRGPEKLELPPV
jgi:hypothetical protein